MPNATFSAVLFDLDGTLADSLRDIADAMNAALALHNLPTHPLTPYNHFVGDGVDQLASRVLPPHLRHDDALRASLVREMKTIYATTWRLHTVPYPGIPELLDSLATRGLRLGVLSNKPDPFTREMVAHVFPHVRWHAVRGARNGVPLKPAPDAALDILRDWSLLPTDILYVGDTATDMLTARNAAFHSVGVTWGFRDRQELQESGAHHLINHPLQLLDLLVP